MVNHTKQIKVHLEDILALYGQTNLLNIKRLVVSSTRYGLLCEEYTHRYGKVHSCENTVLEAGHLIPKTQWKDQNHSHLQDPMSLNMTQALTLLLLTNVIYRPNLGLHLIIYVTHPKNQIGYERI